MPSPASLRVLFRAPAGPRRGFGHLLRCRALARALGIVPVVSLRATRATATVARRLGCTVVDGGAAAALTATRAQLLVVDDLMPRAAARWIDAARRRGVPVISIHDLGLGCLDADLLVDGSVVGAVRVAPRRRCAGLRFAILDPSFARVPPTKPSTVRRVLVALGGGPRRQLALAIARAIVARQAGVTVRIAGGFAGGLSKAESLRIRWTGVRDGLAGELAACDLAVVGGGVSLYEACASGVPIVALPVAPAQAPTVRGFARLRACVSLPATAGPGGDVAAVARAVTDLAADGARRRRLARAARQLVDGRGAQRVAAAVRRLAGRPSR